MTTKSVFQIFDEDALEHYGLENAPKYGVFSSSNNECYEVLKVSDSIYYSIQNTLSVETLSSTWKNYKRAFVMPKCPITLARIKSIAKENNIVIVNDYTKADFIITHDEFYDTYNHNKNILLTHSMYELKWYTSIKHTNGSIPKIDSFPFPVINTDLNVSWTWDTISHSNSSIITGLALNIAHKLELNELEGVLHIDTLIDSAKSTQPLTQDLLDNIVNMLSSSSDDDLEIVGKIIPTIDTNQNHHMLWDLFKQKGNSLRYKFTKNKDVKNWLNSLEYDYEYSNAEHMIVNLKKDNRLDKASFIYFEKIARTEIVIYNRDLYNFQVSIKPEYKEFLNNDEYK